MADARRDGENVDEPPVQRIALDQVQFKAMLADVTHQLRGHAGQIYAQANPRVVDPAGIAGKVRGALARQTIRARRGEQAEEDDEREGLANEEDGRRPHRFNNNNTNNNNNNNNHICQHDDSFGNLKLKIPPFQGKADLDAYIEWEQKMDALFKLQRFSEERKVRLAATEFERYAITWWQNLSSIRRRSDESITS